MNRKHAENIEFMLDVTKFNNNVNHITKFCDDRIKPNIKFSRKFIRSYFGEGFYDVMFEYNVDEYSSLCESAFKEPIDNVINYYKEFYEYGGSCNKQQRLSVLKELQS